MSGNNKSNVVTQQPTAKIRNEPGEIKTIDNGSSVDPIAVNAAGLKNFDSSSTENASQGITRQPIEKIKEEQDKTMSLEPSAHDGEVTNTPVEPLNQNCLENNIVTHQPTKQTWDEHNGSRTYLASAPPAYSEPPDYTPGPMGDAYNELRNGNTTGENQDEKLKGANERIKELQRENQAQNQCGNSCCCIMIDTDHKDDLACCLLCDLFCRSIGGILHGCFAACVHCCECCSNGCGECCEGFSECCGECCGGNGCSEDCCSGDCCDCLN